MKITADTNFFVGLMNPDDSLYAESVNLQKKHKGDIQTSLLTIAELFVGCEKRGGDPEAVANAIFEIADVFGISLNEAMKAAHYMKEKNLTAFDALHCALAGDEIISADEDFDNTGVKRIWKEK